MAYNKKVDSKHLDLLFSSIGWKPRGAKWKEVLEKSSFVCSVWDGARLVGFGRIVEDGAMCMFYDVLVRPDYQDRGIGSRIMNYLIGKIKDKKYTSIGLFSWEYNEKSIGFYEKFGFKKVKTGMELVKFMDRV